MLFSPLNPLLDSENNKGSTTLSPPQDGSEFELFPDLAELLKPSASETMDQASAETEQVLPGPTIKAKKVIQVKMSANQEADFLKYLSGETIDGTPCLQVVRDVNLDMQDDDNVSVCSDTSSAVSPTEPTKHSSHAKSVTVLRNTTNRDSDLNFDTYRPFQPCMTKSAVAARENRQKKKMYVEGLEKSVDKLSTENDILKRNVTNMKRTVESLTNEVQYLRSVLANQSALSALLKNISNTPGVQFATSLSEQSQEIEPENINSDHFRQSCKRSAQETPDDELSSPEGPPAKIRTRSTSRKDHSYQRSRNEQIETTQPSDHNQNTLSKTQSAGICLHVSSGRVSLELCSVCSKKSSDT